MPPERSLPPEDSAPGGALRHSAASSTKRRTRCATNDRPGSVLSGTPCRRPAILLLLLTMAKIDLDHSAGNTPMDVFANVRCFPIKAIFTCSRGATWSPLPRERLVNPSTVKNAEFSMAAARCEAQALSRAVRGLS